MAKGRKVQGGRILSQGTVSLFSLLFLVRSGCDKVGMCVFLLSMVFVHLWGFGMSR